MGRIGAGAETWGKRVRCLKFISRDGQIFAFFGKPWKNAKGALAGANCRAHEPTERPVAERTARGAGGSMWGVHGGGLAARGGDITHGGGSRARGVRAC